MSEQSNKSAKASDIFNKKGVAFDKKVLSQSTKHKNKHQILKASDANKNSSSKTDKEKMKQARAMKDKFRNNLQVDRDSALQQHMLQLSSQTRNNTFKDNRDINATEAEVKLALYKQKQQKIRSKKTQQSRFALGDEDGAYEQSLSSRDVLTHGGKAITDLTTAELRAYDTTRDDEEDEYYNGKISKEETMTHFGGGVLTGEQMKLTRLPREEFLALSLADRRKMMVENSKLMKVLRKGQKAEAEELLKEIDLDFNDIRGLLDFSLPGEDWDNEAILDNESSHHRLKNGAIVKKQQSQSEYLNDMLSKYGISNDDTKDGDDEDAEYQDDEDTEDDSDKEKAAEAQLDDKFQSALKNMKQAEAAGEDYDFQYKDDQEWTDALTKLSTEDKQRTARIGLDGKAINSSSTTLGNSGISIGSNIARDDYMAQTLTLSTHARAHAGTRVVSDQEKAARHRSYLLYLEQKRLERKSGDYNQEDHNEDALEREYEQIFLKNRKTRSQQGKEDDSLVVSAMLDGSDDDDMVDVDVSTGLIKSSKNAMGDNDNEDEDEDEYEDEDLEFDEDVEFDEDLEFDEDEESPAKKSTHKTVSNMTSGDSLDDGFDLDDDVGGVDGGFDLEEVQTMDAGGQTTYLVGGNKTKRQKGEESQASRKQRKEDLGMLINDIDDTLKFYYLCSQNNSYRTFIARVKVILRDEIPYNYEFPETFNAFIALIYRHTVPILVEFKRYYEEEDVDLIYENDPSVTHQMTESKLKGITLQLMLGRIFQLYHPRINGHNEAKIELLYRYLWRLLKISTQQYQEYTLEQDVQKKQVEVQSGKTKAYISTSIYDVLAYCDVITHYIFTMNELLPRFTGKACIGLVEMFSQSCIPPSMGSVYPVSDRQTVIQSKQWGTKVVTTLPDLHELFAYKLLMQCYPLSDYRHTIMTSLQLVLCQTMTTCQVLTNIDLVKILFLLGCLLEIWRASDRIIPECFPAIQSTLALINNTYYYYNQTKPATSAPPAATSVARKGTKKATAPAVPANPPTVEFKYIKPLLESYREHGNPNVSSLSTDNIISPSTLSTLCTMQKKLHHSDKRSTGVLPLQLVIYM